jgi:hypothetical protein
VPSIEFSVPHAWATRLSVAAIVKGSVTCRYVSLPESPAPASLDDPDELELDDVLDDEALDPGAPGVPELDAPELGAPELEEAELDELLWSPPRSGLLLPLQAATTHDTTPNATRSFDIAQGIGTCPS